MLVPMKREGQDSSTSVSTMGPGTESRHPRPETETFVSRTAEINRAAAPRPLPRRRRKDRDPLRRCADGSLPAPGPALPAPPRCPFLTSSASDARPRSQRLPRRRLRRAGRPRRPPRCRRVIRIASRRRSWFNEPQYSSELVRSRDSRTENQLAGRRRGHMSNWDDAMRGGERGRCAGTRPVGEQIGDRGHRGPRPRSSAREPAAPS